MALQQQHRACRDRQLPFQAIAPHCTARARIDDGVAAARLQLPRRLPDGGRAIGRSHRCDQSAPQRHRYERDHWGAVIDRDRELSDAVRRRRAGRARGEEGRAPIPAALASRTSARATASSLRRPGRGRLRLRRLLDSHPPPRGSALAGLSPRRRRRWFAARARRARGRRARSSELRLAPGRSAALTPRPAPSRRRRRRARGPAAPRSSGSSADSFIFSASMSRYSSNSPGYRVTARSSITQIWLHTFEMSATEWVITITPPPNSCSAFTRQSTVSRSRWFVGSSSSSRCVCV